MMTSIAPYVAHPLTIAIVIIVLMMWTGVSGYRLRRASNKLRTEVAWARKQIEAANTAGAFASRYEAIAQDLADNPILGPRWREYQHSLWISEGGMIRATTRSDDWFTLDLLRTSKIGIDPRYHAAFATLMSCWHLHCVGRWRWFDRRNRLRSQQSEVCCGHHEHSCVKLLAMMSRRQ
jgi:hypothetical protein